LDKFEAWSTEGVRELLETFIEYAGTERNSLGKCLSRWVQATDSGDELLWKYITRNVSSENVRSGYLRNQLSCDPHNFHQKNFLAERLCQSDDLLNLVLNELERWCTDSAARYGDIKLRSHFLKHTSWRLRGSPGVIHSVDNLTILLDSLEKALQHRSRQNDSWWKANEPRLRATQEEAIRYFVIQAYKENIEANIPGIESQLQDKELFHWSQLSNELRELMQMAYPYISEAVQIANQAMIFSLNAKQDCDVDEQLVWLYRSVCYKFVIWIPSIFRTPETQSFIDTWQDYFGYSQPSPEIRLWGGVVMPPLSPQDLLKLSDSTLFRLLRYYEKCPGDQFDRDLVGGLSEVKSVLREACSLEPRRFLVLFVHFIEENLHQDYIYAVIEGIATHLRYRFGNLRSVQQWEPVVPLPEGETLAVALLNWLERYPIIWEDGRTVSQALEACCDVLDERESAERLTLLLFWLRVQDINGMQIANNETDLDSIAINSTRGVAAKSAMTLCNRLLEKEQSLPEWLPFLLRYFARDSAIYVRVPVLEQLPFLMYKQPDLGWQLLADVFQEPQPHLWKYAERCFYYQYQEHFDRVEPYLNRLLHEGMEEAGDTWGRISTLASLARHLSQEQLFDTLAKNNTHAWRGAVQVFGANLNRQEHTSICHSGMVTVLRHENLSDEAFIEIENCFGEDANRRLIRRELALAFLDALSRCAGRWDIYHFLEWLGYEARRDPLFALDVVEELTSKLEREMKPHQIWHTKPLIAALKEILSEADETDDPELIERAISLQDRFLRLDIHGIEELLAKAGQN
jgi:hypothetical protein